MPPKKYLSQDEKNKETMKEYRSLSLYREPSGSITPFQKEEKRSALDTTPKLRPVKRIESSPKVRTPEEIEDLRIRRLEASKKGAERIRLRKLAEAAEKEHSIFKEQKDIKEMIKEKMKGEKSISDP